MLFLTAQNDLGGATFNPPKSLGVFLTCNPQQLFKK